MLSEVLEVGLRDSGSLGFGSASREMDRNTFEMIRAGAPQVLEDVEAHGTVGVHVAMIVLGGEPHFRRLERIVREGKLTLRKNTPPE